MKKFKDLLNEVLKTCSEKFFMESIESGNNRFVEIPRVNDEYLAHLNMVKSVDENPFAPDDSTLDEKEERAPNKEILVNHGMFVLKNGRKVLPDGAEIPVFQQDSDEEEVKIPDGNIVKVNKFKGIELLKRGWLRWIPVYKTSEDGTVERIGIDPRDLDAYKGRGYEPGWGKFTEIFKDAVGRKKIPSEDLDSYVRNGWKVFEPVIMSRISNARGRSRYRDAETGEYGNKVQKKKTEVRIVDLSEVERFEQEGFSKGMNFHEGYETSFSIAETNTKLGPVMNFSISPGPGAGCPKDVPCSNECYARNCYRNYTECRNAWDKNLKLLKSHMDWFMVDLDNKLNEYEIRHQRMERRNSIRGVETPPALFRWHVAGDILNKQHLDSITKLAENHLSVLFWLYTKNYSLIRGYKPPANLIVIVSAWNDWKLKEVDGTDDTHTGKDGLHKNFPVAYVNDWQHPDCIPSRENSFHCPCANFDIRDDELDYICATCSSHSRKDGEKIKSCYTLKPGESMTFNIH